MLYIHYISYFVILLLYSLFYLHFKYYYILKKKNLFYYYSPFIYINPFIFEKFSNFIFSITIFSNEKKLYLQFTFALRIIFSPIISPIIPDTSCIFYALFHIQISPFKIHVINIRGLHLTNSTPKTTDSGGIPR